jgi:type IV secretory pathway TraG/TraD family ATPase VirD4
MFTLGNYLFLIAMIFTTVLLAVYLTHNGLAWVALVKYTILPVVVFLILSLGRNEFAYRLMVALVIFNILLGFVVLTVAFMRFFNTEKNYKTTLKGTVINENKKQRSSEVVIKKSLAKSSVCFASIPISEDSEPLHFVTIGSTGTGKSTAIKELLFTAKSRGDRLIVCDPDGGYSDAFMSASDVLINPFDSRSVKWDYLAEIKAPYDNMLLASMVIPENSKDDEWRKYARQLLSSLSEKWIAHELGTSDDFFDFLTTGQQSELAALSQGTAAARFFEDGNDRMLGSILGTMTPFLEPMRHLKSIQGAPFSIREWLNNGQGSLYIPYKAAQISALQGLVSAWLGLSIYETLSMPTDEKRRIWFLADEVDAIGRIIGLKDALARLRKFGGRVVLGFQSISQLRLVYGDAEANTIIENCGNKLILRCDSSERGGTADFASRLIGQREVRWQQQSTTSGANGSTSYSTQEKTENAVMASEVSQLPNLAGYLKIANEPVWQTTEFEPVNYLNIT